MERVKLFFHEIMTFTHTSIFNIRRRHVGFFTTLHVFIEPYKIIVSVFATVSIVAIFNSMSFTRLSSFRTFTLLSAVKVCIICDCIYSSTTSRKLAFSWDFLHFRFLKASIPSSEMSTRNLQLKIQITFQNNTTPIINIIT